MKAKIYINRKIIASNKKKTQETGEIIDEPAIAVKTYKGGTYTKKINLGNGITLIQDAKNPICTGATIWIEVDDISIIMEKNMPRRDESSFGVYRKINGKKFELYEEAISVNEKKLEEEIQKIKEQAKKEYKYIRTLKNKFDQRLFMFAKN